MKHITTGLSAALLAMVAGTADAGDWSLSAGAGTLGLGATAGYEFNEHFGLRLGGYAFSVSDTGERSGVEYDGDLDLSNIGLVADWYPFGGSFHVSAGWFATDNGLKADGRPGPGGTYDIGGQTFTADEVGTLHAVADLGNSGAFVGLGWLWGRADGGLEWSLDLGVLLQDSPDVTLTATGGSLSGQPALQSALAQEEVEVEDDIDSLKTWPVVNFGIGYRF